MDTVLAVPDYSTVASEVRTFTWKAPADNPNASKWNKTFVLQM